MALEVTVERQLGRFRQEVAFSTSGEALGLLGASGSGKSLTLRTIAGIEKPDRGRIVLNGRVLFDSEKKIDLPPRKRRVGYLFQNYALFPTMTAEENIAASITDNKEKHAAKIRDMIDRYRLSGLEHHYPHQLSGGQQQRVALARLMMTDPEVILLDEPFSALDSFLKEQMLKELLAMISDYRGDVILVSHSRDDIYKTCPRLAVISDGKLLIEGPTKEIFRRPRYIEACRLTGCKNISPAGKTGPNTLYAEDWKIELTAADEVPDNIKAVGIRAHYVKEASDENVNTAPFKLVSLIETPFEYHYSVRNAAGGSDLIRMVPKDEGALRGDHFEGRLYLPPEHLMILTE